MVNGAGPRWESVSTQKQALQSRTRGAGWARRTCSCNTLTNFTRFHFAHTFALICRNIPVAAAWVLRPNVRPAARSARMIDMILLGCCVSGAGCVGLADWSAGLTGRLFAIPHAVFICPSLFCSICPSFLPKKRFDSPFFGQICITFWP